MYQIGEFSKINRITIKTLRYYDRVGLLKPAFVDDNNGYRYYTSEQLPIIHKIIALRQMDFSINEILDLLTGEDDNLIFKTKKEKLLNDIQEKKLRRLNLKRLKRLTKLPVFFIGVLITILERHMLIYLNGLKIITILLVITQENHILMASGIKK